MLTKSKDLTPVPIVLNPVRAKMVKTPAEWKWSSYRAAMGQEPAPEWLDTGYIHEQFGGSPKEAALRYARFVADQAGQQAPWDDAVGQIFLGDQSFIEAMIGMIAEKFNRSEIPLSQRHAGRATLAELLHGSTTTRERNSKIVEAHVLHGYKQSEIAKHTGLHYVSVSRIIRAHGA